MSSASSNSAAEQQLPVRIVKNSLSGGRGMEAFGFVAIIIAKDRHPRNARGIVPQICFYPILRHTRWAEEEHMRGYAVLTVCHKQRQLTDGGACAGAMRMHR